VPAIYKDSNELIAQSLGHKLIKGIPTGIAM
jgi:hypothetical protein